VIKLSSGKASKPGRKQVFRGPGGDVLGLRDEPLPDDHEPLLQPFMADGRRTGAGRSLADANARFRADLARLPASARRIVEPEPIWGRDSDALLELTERAKAEALARAGVTA
jgi:nicotinate phosphoribosyltransferase